MRKNVAIGDSISENIALPKSSNINPIINTTNASIMIIAKIIRTRVESCSLKQQASIASIIEMQRIIFRSLRNIMIAEIIIAAKQTKSLAITKI